MFCEKLEVAILQSLYRVKKITRLIVGEWSEIENHGYNMRKMRDFRATSELATLENPAGSLEFFTV